MSTGAVPCVDSSGLTVRVRGLDDSVVESEPEPPQAAIQQSPSALLRALRAEAGLRQIDVAKRLGVNQTFVSKYENGERSLDLIELRSVCQALGTTLAVVVDEFEKRVSR